MGQVWGREMTELQGETRNKTEDQNKNKDWG